MRKRIRNALLVVALMLPAIVCAQDVSSFTNEAELIAWHKDNNVPRGDMQLNGDVAFGDFLTFIENLDRRSPDLTYLDGDLNLDGAVDLGDIAIFTNNYGVVGYQPEPAVRPAFANLGLHLDEESKIVISSALATDILGIELRSTTDALIPVTPIVPGLDTVPAPFTSSIVRPSSNRIAWSDLVPVSVDGDIISGVGTQSADVSLHWIEEGSYTVYSQSLNQGAAITGRPITTRRTDVVDPPDPPAREYPEEFGSNRIAPTNDILPHFDPFTHDFDAAQSAEQLLEIHQNLDLPRGDMDGNGTVDSVDYTLFGITSYAHPNITKAYDLMPGYGSGDLDLDGDAGSIQDFAIFADNFGQSGYTSLAEQVAPAKVSAVVNDQGVVVLSSDRSVEITAIELKSAGNELTAQFTEEQDPLTLLVHTDINEMLWGFADSSLTVDGELATGIEVNRPAGTEFDIRWSQLGSAEVFSLAPFDLSLADIDQSGDIGFADFLVLSANFGNVVDVGTLGDIDKNGLVAFSDFLILSAEFGTIVPTPARSQAVPEPAGSKLLFALVICSSLQRRRRRV